MPQNKLQPKKAGNAYPALRADIIHFIKRWKGPAFTIHESGLRELCMWATEPERWLRPGVLTPESLVREYILPEPELTFALLAFIHKKWIGRNTKSQRIQNFLATHDGFKPLPDSRPKWQWKMTDGEIATGYQTATEEEVGVEDVVKARKALTLRINRGLKFGPYPQRIKGGKTYKKPSV